MIAADPSLVAFMEGNNSAVRLDLYTITLASGAVLRWSNGSAPVTLPGGPTFSAGPLLERSRLVAVSGVQVDELHLKITPTAQDQVGGVPLMQLAMLGGLRGCNVLLQWAYFDTTPAHAYQGIMDKFSGQGSPIAVQDDEIDLLVRSEMERLLVMMPGAVYQAKCLNTVYDAQCGVARLPRTVAGAVTGLNSLKPRSAFGSALAQAPNFFDLGVVRFTSGPNAGHKRMVRSFAFGAFTFALPFPFAIEMGDAFDAWPGCNGTQATCTAKFSNLLRFRGQPYIPAPEVTT